jgi:hypothetical protein
MADERPLAGHNAASDFCLFGHLECVVHLDPEIPNGALKLGMTKQDLHSSKVLRAPTNQRRFRTAHRVRAVCRIVQPDGPDPSMDKARVLTS